MAHHLLRFLVDLRLPRVRHLLAALHRSLRLQEQSVPISDTQLFNLLEALFHPALLVHVNVQLFKLDDNRLQQNQSVCG